MTKVNAYLGEWERATPCPATSSTRRIQLDAYGSIFTELGEGPGSVWRSST